MENPQFEQIIIKEFIKTEEPEEWEDNEEFSQDTLKFFWSRGKTKALINLCKKYRPVIGTTGIKTLKTMWSLIALELNRMFPDSIISVTSSHCENKWRVLQRNYKKYVESCKLTGNAKREFEFAAEMEAINNRQMRLKPADPLTTETTSPSLVSICIPQNIKEYQTYESTGTEIKNNARISSNESPVVFSFNKNKDLHDRTSIIRAKRRRKSFWQKIKEEELLIKKQKLRLAQKKLILFKKRNELLAQYNAIIAQSCNLCKIKSNVDELL